ncbi:hypothetical protein V8E54_010859 [Elaphomyces granulatus]
MRPISYSKRRGPNDYSVAFNSSVSENQPLENSVRGGHLETDSMQNDLALGLLALLVPWERLPSSPGSTVPPDVTSIAAQRSGSRSGYPCRSTFKMLLGTCKSSRSRSSK